MAVLDPPATSAETISVEEAARRLGVGRSLAYQLASRGEFPTPVVRVGRRLLVLRRPLDDLLAGRKEAS